MDLTVNNILIYTVLHIFLSTINIFQPFNAFNITLKWINFLFILIICFIYIL